jgi:hypothetical protein
MRHDVILRCLGLGAALVLGLMGCSSETGGNTSGGTSGGNTSGGMMPKPTPAPEFPSNSGQAAKSPLAYPAGPYGVRVGSVMPNLQWVGFQNAASNNTGMQAIELADFYNPHADDPTYMPADADHDDRLFPKGSLYGDGTPKPKALAIDVASVWCGPCNEEAKSVLPGQYATFKPMGGEFLLQLADGPTGGVSAKPKDLLNWTKKYKVNFPATIDPTYTIGKFFSADAYPANLQVDTRTMKIVTVIAGVPDAAYWTKFASVINGK